MEQVLKQVVSMLVSEGKITLFTITGEIIEIKNDGDYDTVKISEFLTPKLSGLGAVEIDLNQYTRIVQILPSDLEEHGIVVTQIIDGREVQGIFYPHKVAVQVTVGEDKIAIPDVENLTGHIKRAAAEQSPSVANFLKRLAPVLQARKHSGEDLMKFIKQSEMPLTNDGRIIAYKRVQSTSEKDIFVDCHTKSVKQRVGSRVSMEVDLVDPSRHNSCSTGLHVANLGYMKGFHGTHTLIVLVNPEDFIAVPKGEDTKARVCAYEVIGVMSDSAHNKVNTGSHVEGDTSLQALIKAAVEGRQVQPNQEVKVGENGAILKTEAVKAAPVPTTTPVAISSGKSLNEGKDENTPARDVLKATRAAQAKTTPVEIPDEVVEAFDLLLSGVSKNQVANRFETSSRSIGRWMEKWNYDSYAAANQAPPERSAYDDATQEELEDTAAFMDQLVENGGTNEGMGTMMPEPQPKESTVTYDNFAKLVQSSEAPKPATKVEQMRKLFNNWILGGKKESDLNTMKLFKSASKKSWNALGLTLKEEDSIKTAE